MHSGSFPSDVALPSVHPPNWIGWRPPKSPCPRARFPFLGAAFSAVYVYSCSEHCSNSNGPRFLFAGLRKVKVESAFPAFPWESAFPAIMQLLIKYQQMTIDISNCLLGFRKTRVRKRQNLIAPQKRIKNARKREIDTQIRNKISFLIERIGMRGG